MSELMLVTFAVLFATVSLIACYIGLKKHRWTVDDVYLITTGYNIGCIGVLLFYFIAL